jgi:hypothetical protein
MTSNNAYRLDVPWVQRARWRDRLTFNCWRRPFPYLAHRWEVVDAHGWIDCGSRAYCERWVAAYRAAKVF